ncbi:MAG TPA: hypothetical protein VK168_12835 [Saprospiraceae bacterium]|nr:hypothetical protein [Saprospiraceae bacterium]
MKISIISTVFTFLVGTAILLSSCKEKCSTCHTEADCIQGKCVCNEGRYSFNNSCVLLGNESYIGINAACYCYDTLIMSIDTAGEIRGIGIAIRGGSSSVGSLSQTVFYYETPTGDSMYSPQLDLRCFAPDDTPLKPAAYGKKQANGNWDLLLEFRNAFTYEVVDSCHIVLEKFKG